MNQIMFYLLIIFYVVGFLFFTYICMIADPNENQLAAYLGYDLPDQVSERASKILGKKVMHFFTFLSDFALVVVYLAIVLGCWNIIFFFAYPWMDETDGYISKYHQYNGYFVFVACIMSWRLASSSNPGIITSQNLLKFDNYPYDGTLFEPTICPTVGIRKLARSKFDRYSEIHVARFDHFCGWLHNPVGEENYRWFLLFLVVHVAMCAYGSVVMGYLFQYEIDKHQLWNVTFYNVANGEEFKATWFVVLQYMFQKHKMCSAVFLVMFIMGIALGFFLVWHLRIASIGMTTNESVKWSSVKTWYKKELQLYNDAVKAGIVVEQDASDLNNKPVVPDGDVTCVPGSQNTKNDHDVGEKEEEETTTEKITHPGPMPKNIYDRGVVENWKEVLFPRSLRSDAMERYRKSLLREYARRQQEAVTEGREIDSTASASTPSAVLDPGKQKSN